MNTSSLPRQQLLQSIADWAQARPDIRALALVGSSARSDYPADPWSDIDLIMMVSDPTTYLHASGWIQTIAEPWISTVERSPAGEIVEKRVLFRNGVDADFIVLGRGRIQALREEPLQSITARGMRVLLDKDGALASFHPAPLEEGQAHPPSAGEFSELVNDFWFQAVWAAKKIRRGELWSAKSCCDVYLKRLLLTMIEWHTHARRGWSQQTWYNGRFIERWADPAILERLRGAFGHYDEADLWQALWNTIDLFDQIAQETARQWEYDYPESAARGLKDWLAARLEF